MYNGAREEKPCVWPTFDPPLPGMNFTYGLPSPKSGLFGYSGGHCMGNKTKDPECVCTSEEYADAMFSGVVDKVRVPAALPPGDYVLSWRWDCEQTKQIWSSCGDVTAHAADAPDAKATVPLRRSAGHRVQQRRRAVRQLHGVRRRQDEPECQYCWTPMLWWAPHDYWRRAAATSSASATRRPTAARAAALAAGRQHELLVARLPQVLGRPDQRRAPSRARARSPSAALARRRSPVGGLSARSLSARSPTRARARARSPERALA